MARWLSMATPLCSVVGCAALAAACSGSHATSPSPTLTTELRVVSAAISGLATALAVGDSVSLQAVLVMSDGTQRVESAGVNWVSGDEHVARVDANGKVTALAEGVVTISASVKNATTSASARVVTRLAGAWNFTFLPTSCGSSNIPGCAGTRFTGPTVKTDSVTFSQAGDRVSGTWNTIPFTGQILDDGSLLLSGTRCSVSETGTVTEFVIRDWRLQRSGTTTSFTGLLHWEQNGHEYLNGLPSCAGPLRYSIPGELQILDFRRKG